jgi:signal peptide peptidase SppA
MLNPLLATFDNKPALLATGFQNQFESYLIKASETLSRIEAASDNPVMADNFWFSPDDWRSIFRPYVVRDGILHIPVKGVLLADFPFAFGTWATGYIYLTKALERGIADPEVKGIAWVINSPGGHVAENFDLGDKIFAARDKKPMRAYANESAYSAAYSIASAVGQITVARTGGVGSIGVVTVHVDVSKAVEADGYKITFIHYGKHKVDGNPYEALPADVKDRIQARIDELGEIFVSAVARNRAMDAQVIRNTEALTYTATQAVSNGLADKIGSFDDAIAAFAADLSLNDEDETMMTEDEKKAAAQAADTARAEGIATGKAEGAKEGATAMQVRIAAILDSEEGKKRPAAARMLAFDTDKDATSAIASLAKLPEEKVEAAPIDDKVPKGKDGAAADFQNAMNNSEHPNAGSPGGKDGEGADKTPRHERALALSGKPKKAA